MLLMKREELKELREMSQAGGKMMAVLPEITGMAGKKTYLVVFQNSAEHAAHSSDHRRIVCRYRPQSQCSVVCVRGSRKSADELDAVSFLVAVAMWGAAG